MGEKGEAMTEVSRENMPKFLELAERLKTAESMYEYTGFYEYLKEKVEIKREMKALIGGYHAG